jgi:hypothetical protein
MSGSNRRFSRCPPASVMIMRWMDDMDNKRFLLRGWREALALDNAVDSGKAQGFSRVIEKYLLACEKRGWEVGEGETGDVPCAAACR